MKIRVTLLLFGCIVLSTGCSQEMITSLLERADSGSVEDSDMEMTPVVAEEVKSEEEERARKIRVAVKLKTKNYKKDLVELNAAVSLADGAYVPYLERAVCHADFGNYNRSIKDANSALELAEEENVMIYLTRSHAFAESGNYKAAMNDVDEAISMYPDFVELLFMKGYVFEKQGDYVRALDEYQITINYNDQLPSVWNSYASVLCLAPDAKVRNGKKAVEAAIKAVTLSAGSKDQKAISLDTLGSAWAEMGDFEKAIKSAKVAFKTAPSDDADLLIEIDKHIKLYESGKPARYPEEESKVAKENATDKTPKQTAAK